MRGGRVVGDSDLAETTRKWFDIAAQVAGCKPVTVCGRVVQVMVVSRIFEECFAEEGLPTTVVRRLLNSLSS